MGEEFDDFVASHHHALLRLGRALTFDRFLAEDLVQEVLLKSVARWAEISACGSPYGYVRRMLVNEFISWKRRASHADVIRFEPDMAEPEADPTNRFVERNTLMVQLATLPPKQRAVIVLRFFVGMSDREIAEELGCSAGTVRSHVSRALRSLRIEVEQHDADNSRERHLIGTARGVRA